MKWQQRLWRSDNATSLMSLMIGTGLSSFGRSPCGMQRQVWHDPSISFAYLLSSTWRWQSGGKHNILNYKINTCTRIWVRVYTSFYTHLHTYPYKYWSCNYSCLTKKVFNNESNSNFFANRGPRFLTCNPTQPTRILKSIQSCGDDEITPNSYHLLTIQVWFPDTASVSKSCSKCWHYLSLVSYTFTSCLQ